MNKSLTALIFLLFFNIVFCQPTTVDENSPKFKEILDLVYKAEEYKVAENFNESIIYYQKAIQKFKTTYSGEAKNYYGYGIFLNNLAILYRDTEQYEKALPLQLEALENGKQTLGINHSAYGMHLSNLAILYGTMEQYEKAIPLQLEAITNTEKTLGKDHPEYGIRLSNLAFFYLEVEEYDKALSIFLKAIKIINKTHGILHSQYGITIDGLANLYRVKGKYQKALPLQIQAFENIKMNFDKTHPSYGICLQNLANLYIILEKYNKALPLQLEALQLAEIMHGKENILYGDRLNNLAILYKDMGRYDKALKLQLESLENTKINLGVYNERYATDLNNLAVIYETLGLYKKALPLLIEALNITEKSKGKNHENYALVLNNIAKLYYTKGQYKNAILYYKNAINIIEKVHGKNHSNYSIYLNNLTTLYGELGQFDRAVPLQKEVLKNIELNIGKASTSYLIYSNNLAFLYKNKGQYRKALSLYLEVLNNIEKHLGKDHISYAICSNNLANLYIDLGEFKKALPLIEEALDNTEKNLGRNTLDYGNKQNSLGYLYVNLESFEEATTLFNEVLESTKRDFGKRHQRYGVIVNNLVTLYEISGQYENALPLILEVNKNNLNQIQDNFSYMTLGEKENFIKNSVKGDLNIYNKFNYLTKNSYPEMIISASNNILISKGLLLNSSKNILNDLQVLRQEDLSKKIADFRSKKASINKQLQLPVNQRSEDFAKVEEELTELERELVTTYSKNFGEDISYIKDYKETLLKDNELAIEFTNFRLLNKRATDSIMYVAYLYKKEWKTPKVVNLFEEKQLKKHLAFSTSPNKLYRSRGGKLVDKKGIIADSIYNLVWKPLEPYIQNASTIYYSPDGLLHKIPFAVLPNEDNKLLGERYNLNQMGNTADIRKNNKLPDLNDVLLIGGVDYTYTIPDSKKDSINPKNNFSILQSEQLLGNTKNKKRSNGDGIWDYLEGTDKEVKAIKALLPKSKVLTQKKATEKAFKNLSGNSPSVLHIATHGYFFPNLERKKEDFRLGNEKTYIHSENPLLRSGLILANANYAWKHGSNPYEEEDGILTALEISNLNLRNTDIVILSACETGLGDIPSSEGVYGLQRAFKMAGVETIIMTLWEVPDTETAEFMNLFYTKWKATNNPKKAFKETQRIMMNRYRNDPEKWAAFVYFE
ncbi:CHAT domain-containing protein [Kordia sp.]|uniref:CHAT domain-containing protein n=1 Tax=Kordia sp. TaxID=1965332 RepID=UPI003D26CB93